MIADAVEASTRAMPEPTTPKLQAQVQKMINIIFSEGQLDECDLTLKDLNLIAQLLPAHARGHLPRAPGVPGGRGGRWPEGDSADGGVRAQAGRQGRGRA